MSFKFTTALSLKSGEQAAKEISLKIKSVFPKEAKYVIILATPHYQPLTTLKILDFTLKPKKLMGLQAPLLIFESAIVKKGMIGLCFDQEDAIVKDLLTQDVSSQSIESLLRLKSKDLNGPHQFLFSCLPPEVNYSDYLRGVELSLGKAYNVFGAGFMKKYASRQFHITNGSVDQGLFNIAGTDIKIDTLNIGGYLPLGRPFVITKVVSDKGLIMEINNRPAMDIYKKYFEEKFDDLKNRNFFPLYPLGVKENGNYRMISILNYLEDGSLICLGDVKENTQAHFMLLHQPTLFETIGDALKPIRKNGEGLIFMINSMLRKKILMDGASEEVYQVKHHLGEKFKIIGMFADYIIFPNREKREIGMDTGSLLVTSWR